MATSKFGTAFAAARKAGDKTFEFNGKKFTTETKDDQRKASEKRGGQGGRSGPTAGELEKLSKSKQDQFQAAQTAAKTPDAKAAREKQAQNQALGGVHPELMLGGAGLMKMAAGRAGANTAPKVASKVAEQAKTLVAKDRRMAAIPGRRAANAQQAKDNIAKFRAKEGSGSGAKAVTKSRTKFKDDEVGVEFKRGGSVRGDGCATKGKTKGRMV
jgi:hypothetical protein